MHIDKIVTDISSGMWNRKSMKLTMGQNRMFPQDQTAFVLVSRFCTSHSAEPAKETNAGDPARAQKLSQTLY
jgi:hypothetical protein